MVFKPALTPRAALLGLLLAAAWAVLLPAQPCLAQPGNRFSAVTLETVVLTGAAGGPAQKAEIYTPLDLVRTQGGRLAVRPVQAGSGSEDVLFLKRSQAAVVAGQAKDHQKRLNRLRKMSLPPAVSRRLASGVIEAGDSLWHVEMAWGRPERSFMVNYLSDEQHFVYFLPGRAKALLKFEQGKLIGPVPGPRKQDISGRQGPVEKAPTSR